MDGTQIANQVNEMLDTGEAKTITEALRIIGRITGDKPGALYQRMWRNGITAGRRLRIPKGKAA
jgi:hypothetical protein